LRANPLCVQNVVLFSVTSVPSVVA